MVIQFPTTFPSGYCSILGWGLRLRTTATKGLNLGHLTPLLLNCSHIREPIVAKRDFSSTPETCLASSYPITIRGNWKIWLLSLYSLCHRCSFT